MTPEQLHAPGVTDLMNNHSRLKRSRRAKLPTTEQMIVLARVQSAGCPIDQLHFQLLYATSASEDPECRMPLPVARGDGITAAWKPRDIKQLVKPCLNANQAREWLAYLFVVVHERLELCRFIQAKIGVPPPEGLKLFKILLSLTKELMKLGCSQGETGERAQAWAGCQRDR